MAAGVSTVSASWPDLSGHLRLVWPEFKGSDARDKSGPDGECVSAHRPEELSDLADIQLRLLECGEMAALLHLAPMRDVAEVRLHPAPHRRDDLPGKDSHARRHLDDRRGPALAEAFPIEPRRRGRGLRRPVEHDVVEQLVLGEDVLGMTVAIGPGPEFFQNPGRLPARRIRQAVAECLRPRRLLLRIAGVEVDVMLEAGERAFLFRCRLTLDLRCGVEGERDVDAGAMLVILHAKRGRHRRAPVAALRAITDIAEPV